MNIYIDLGAHTGKTVEARLRDHDEDLVIAFEPNPACLKHARWGQLRQRYGTTLVVLAEAAWVQNTQLQLYRDPERLNGQSSTILGGKRSGEISYQQGIPVPAVDFSAWLQEFCTREDHVVIKMDIEGAEYAVLGKMIADGTLELVDALLIEFHWQKFDDELSQERHEHLLAELRSRRCLALTVFSH